MKHTRLLPAVTVLLLLCLPGFSQDTTFFFHKALHFPDKIFKKIDDKASGIDARLTEQTEKYLDRLAKEEKKLKKKLAKKDTAAAARLFGDTEQQYARLKSKLQQQEEKTGNRYLPHLDTLRTAFSFLNTGVLPKTPEAATRLQSALQSIDKLQGKFTQAEEVKKYLQQRRQLLQEQLEKYGLAKELKELKKQVYYYQARVEEYTNMFNEPSQVESRVLELLGKTPAFRDFFRNNSQLAEMFRLPGSQAGNATASLQGLQTREALQQELLQRFGTGPAITQSIQQGMQSAQPQLNALKDKLLKNGAGNSEMDMPDFKPNIQKSRSFLRRLEYGTNLQTVKGNNFFPVTSDIGLSVGYKLNNKSVVGIGGSYKMGWGKDISHIAITHEGVGLRSFMDYKIKGSFWLSGGGELNYRSRFSDFEVLKNYSSWQRSALLGVSKKYKISNKFKGNMQLLYDFLWKAQVPRTEAVKLRFGYSF